MHHAAAPLRLMSALALLAVAAPAAADSDAFWGHWSDGRAELSGYHLVQPRYGEMREGHAVLIVVTEPFSRSKGVKVDRYDPRDPDHFTALKLNHARYFQTGLYPYSLMTSVFVDPVAGFAPVKASFSGQEWCGHVYEEAIASGGGVDVRVDSYFEGETSRRTVPVQAMEDALFVTARGLMSGGPGQTPAAGAAEMLPSALFRRLKHRPAQPMKTTFAWSAPAAVTVPAGRFEVRTLSWDRAGTACALDVEVAAPHRIIGWRCADGEKAELTGSMRSPYWQKSGNGDASLRAKLGLPISTTGR